MGEDYFKSVKIKIFQGWNNLDLFNVKLKLGIDYMNVLFTCVGRRDYLVNYFRDALNGTGLVIGTNGYAECAGMVVADKAIVVPPIKHPEYIDSLLEICKKYDGPLIIPLIDLELPILSRERHRFLEVGAIPIVSSPDVVDVGHDKWLTYKFAIQNNFNSPQTYIILERALQAIKEGELKFPLVLKPRWGAGSIGLEFPTNVEELNVLYKVVKRKIQSSYIASESAFDPDRDIIIQEKLQGIEYGLDVVNNLDRQHVACFVKHKIEMRAGETDRGMTVFDEALIRLGNKIGNTLRNIGLISVDVIRKNGKDYLIEINHRFSGHYPFAHMAGANIPAALIAWAKGKTPDKRWLRVKPNVMSFKGITLLKYR